MCFENIQEIYKITPIPKGDFNKFAAHFQNTFSQEHFWKAASVFGSEIFKTNVRFEVSNFKIGYMQNFVERLESLYFLAQKTQIWAFGLEV